MLLLHKTPCETCPFRKDSMGGFLGGTELAEWVAAWQADCPFPCHNTVSDDDIAAIRDGDLSPLDDAAYCVGALICMRNSAKAPRNTEVRKVTREIEPDRDTVFDHFRHFYSHHGGK